jgi:predicted enzyme involved in methoxymalonyl-ACP biosynthesis
MLEKEEKRARITNFILSCRVLGRDVELWLTDYIVEYVRVHNILTLLGTLRMTPRNAPVHDFYHNAGFRQIDQLADEIHYALDVQDYAPRRVSHIRHR